MDTNPSSTTYGEYYVALELNDSGKEKFAQATERLSQETPKGIISIWMDDTMISYPQVQSAITDGHVQILLGSSDDAAREQAITLANQINSGALPFALEAENFSTISPSLGANSLGAMVLAGVVAFLLVALFMILKYRLPGFVASIALFGANGHDAGLCFRLFCRVPQLYAYAAWHCGHYSCHWHGGGCQRHYGRAH